MTHAIQSPFMAAGYVNACGTPEARAAIATYHSNQLNDDFFCKDIVTVTPEDVIVGNGASGALELALTSLLDEDTVLLAPCPGFPLYQVIAESHGARVVHYNLIPDQGWECDLNHMESLILEEHKAMKENKIQPVVRGIVVNNPSNPTGAVYSEQHLMRIVQLAEKYHLPIVSDEIYGDMTFDGEMFHPMAKIAARLGRRVPVITASGLGKQCEILEDVLNHDFCYSVLDPLFSRYVCLGTDLVPGWRLGWIVFHDR